jgi:Ni/Fe-hydrogenase subunit HybB-like protein
MKRREEKMLNKLNIKASFWTIFFAAILPVFGYALFRRFFFGLGSISNLSDDMPWGLWIGFDLLCGVALAAGGFTVTGVVVILHLDKFKPIVRSTVLTAFIGYLMVIFALTIDVGKPWNLWRPLFYWNKHSVMWEVGLCVTFYTSVLFLEFLPLVWERFGFKKVLRFWHWLTPMFVIAGILLSTLHQSSLGTLYVIAPSKLHPLWYSPILPILFFTSAICLGLAMTCCESFLSFRGLGKAIEHDILEKVGKATAVMLMLYLTIRIEDLIVRGSIKEAFKFNLAAVFFFIEVVLLGIVPMLLLFRSSVRNNPILLVMSQFLVVLGTIFNRMNVAITSFQIGTGAKYFPHPLEIVVSVAVVAIGFFLFYMAVKFLPVFPEGPLSKAEPKNPFEEFSLKKD